MKRDPRMTKANRKTVSELIKHFKTGHWTCITMRDPIQLGEYGRRELYSWEGMPLFQLDIRFNPPETKAFVIENWPNSRCGK